jgi:hypothetical protein
LNSFCVKFIPVFVFLGALCAFVVNRIFFFDDIKISRLRLNSIILYPSSKKGGTFGGNRKKDKKTGEIEVFIGLFDGLFLLVGRSSLF